MARPGMNHLIQQLRLMTQSNGHHAEHWTNERLEVALDWYRKTYWRVRLWPLPEEIDGQPYTYRFELPDWARDFEQNAADSGWRIYDLNGSLIDPSHYQIDNHTGIITFAENKGDMLYFADFRTYDLKRSAADVWELKAAVAQYRPSQPQGGETRQDYSYCQEQAEWFRHQAQASFVHLLYGNA